MSERKSEWEERKTAKRERDPVLEDKFWAVLIWSAIGIGLIALDLAQHGFRFGF